jgi:hypothetical protein
MGPSLASPRGRLRYTWGDVFLTVVGVLGTLLAMGKADEVAEQGGSIVPFWVPTPPGRPWRSAGVSTTFVTSRQYGAAARVAGPAVPSSPWPRRGW